MVDVSDIKAKIQNVAFRGYADGSVDFFGSQIEILTGYSKDDFLSRKIKWIDIILEQDKRNVKEAFVHALKMDKTYSRQYRIRTKVNEILWIQEWGQIVCDDQGNIEYVIGIIVDITDKKRLEDLALRIQERSGKYLIFSLNDQEYAIPIRKVKEIVGLLPITSIPQSLAYILGIINLRGKIIPVVDLRSRLNLSPRDFTERSGIIIVDVEVGNIITPLGIIVDSVSEVLYIQGDHIEETKEVFHIERSEIIFGVAKVEDKMKIILNVDNVIGMEELGKMVSSNDKYLEAVQ